MSKFAEQATNRHQKGYNCAQSVACTFCDFLNTDEQVMFKIMEGFGAGMGGKQEVCGAVSGAVAVAGVINSEGDLADPGKTKPLTYELAKEIQRKFAEKNGTLICCELRDMLQRNGYETCDGYIVDAVQIIEDMFKTKA